MVESLCTNYGEKIAEEKYRVGVTEYAGESEQTFGIETREYFAFPTLERLATIPEGHLRSLGFGYRARYIPTAAKQILEKDVDGRCPCFALPFAS